MSDRLSLRALLERPLPEGSAARLDEAAATLGALLEEKHRLERLGFELPLARCHEQVRYWGFVTRLLEISATADAMQGEASWPSAPR
jgi:hypothetical protein